MANMFDIASTCTLGRTFKGKRTLCRHVRVRFRWKCLLAFLSVQAGSINAYVTLHVQGGYAGGSYFITQVRSHAPFERTQNIRVRNYGRPARGVYAWMFVAQYVD
jgi:hypothetical protein